MLNGYFKQGQDFGYKFAILKFLIRILNKFKLDKSKLARYITNQIDYSILNYIYIYYNDIISNYQTKCNEDKENISTNSTIWIFWWQGEEQAPKTVRKCIENVIKFKGEHEVVLLTKYNYKEYLSIPKYILEKVDAGNITLTHFSDIIRMMLLAQYGGIWMDATLLLTDEFSKEIYTNNFYTNKLYNRKGSFISEYRWSGFFICSTANNDVVCFTRDILLDYWKKENQLITYLFVDYIIQAGYERIPKIKKCIDNVPYNNPNIHDMVSKFNNPYDDDVYMKMIEKTYMFKLSWKNQYTEIDNFNKPTFYNKVILN